METTVLEEDSPMVLMLSMWTFRLGTNNTFLKNFIQLNLQDVQTTEWRAGGVAEVGWGIVANHGGGYSYRLCPKPTNENDVVTEDCFQQTPLK